MKNFNRFFFDWELEKMIICCFLWQFFLFNNNVKKVLKIEEELEGIDNEKIEICEVSDNVEEIEKVSFLVYIKRKVIKCKVMVVICFCFMYFILEGEYDRNLVDKEKGESDKNL